MNKIISLLLFSFLFSIGSLSNAFAEYKVALILDKGGKDDKSFNSAAYEGANKAKQELGIQLKYVEAMDDAAVETTMRSFAQKNFDLIIGVGFSMAESIQKVAKQYPNIHFAIVDGDGKEKNVRNLLFEEHQGSYLVGAIAALQSKTGIIGFLGGMDVPLIRRFQMGYEAGAKKINPKIKVLSNYIGITSEAWNNPPKAKEISLSLISQGADIIFAAAGASNYGLFDAAEDKKKFAIGVDSNQNWVKPGVILTSMLKRVDVAVYQVMKDSYSGKFTGGTFRFGLENQGVDYSVDQYNDKILKVETRKKVDELKKEILSGKIKVPDYYLQHGK